MSGIAAVLPEYLETGELARLLPVGSESNKEQRVTSSVLATFMSVPSFAQAMFKDVGAPTGKRVQIECFTEVVFKRNQGERLPRPDGLIVVKSGRRSWSALIEAKVGGHEINANQIAEYLWLAKTHSIDALITLSNQFAAVPSHHPVEVMPSKRRGVELFHFSWMSIVTRAQLLSESKELEDPEQAFIMRELIRYLQHESTGIVAFNRMGKHWKEICLRIQRRASISRNDRDLVASVGDWHSLTRFMALELTGHLGRPVNLGLSRAHADDASKRIEADINTLLSTFLLQARFKVPDAASDIEFSADLLARTITFSMTLKPPKDKSRATTAINFYARQLKGKSKLDNVVMRVHWPGKRSPSDGGLREVIDDPRIVVGDNSKLPKEIEIVRVLDLAGKFQASRNFVDATVTALRDFYADVGQHLTEWTPSPPKIRASAAGEMHEGEDKPQTVPSLEAAATVPESMGSFSEHKEEVAKERQLPKGDDELRIPTFLIRRNLNE